MLNADNIKKLGISNKSHSLSIQGVPRQCISRDLAFSGAKTIVAGVGKFLVDKEAVLNIVTSEDGTLKIPGKIVRNETVQGRKDLIALALFFDEKQVPIEYKLMLNEFLKLRKIGPEKDNY